MKYIVILAYHYSPSTFIPAFGCSLTSSENWRSFIFCSFQKAWEWRHLPLIWLKVNISVGTVLFENSLVYWSWNSSYSCQLNKFIIGMNFQTEVFQTPLDVSKNCIKSNIECGMSNMDGVSYSTLEWSSFYTYTATKCSVPKIRKSLKKQMNIVVKSFFSSPQPLLKIFRYVLVWGRQSVLCNIMSLKFHFFADFLSSMICMCVCYQHQFKRGGGFWKSLSLLRCWWRILQSIFQSCHVAAVIGGGL